MTEIIKKPWGSELILKYNEKVLIADKGNLSVQVHLQRNELWTALNDVEMIIFPKPITKDNFNAMYRKIIEGTYLNYRMTLKKYERIKIPKCYIHCLLKGSVVLEKFDKPDKTYRLLDYYARGLDWQELKDNL